MENLIYVLFLCIVTPMLLLILLTKKKSKLITGYMVIGIASALFISELNNIVLSYLGNDSYFVSTTLTPITEEIIKALPILFFAYMFSDNLEILLPLSFSTGIGFALFENMVLLLNLNAEISIGITAVRGLATALMHGVCTAAVGLGMSYVKKKKELFYCGTFGLLIVAILYHGFYNMLVQSSVYVLGFILPVITYIPLLLRQYNYIKAKRNKEVEHNSQ